MTHRFLPAGTRTFCRVSVLLGVLLAAGCGSDALTTPEYGTLSVTTTSVPNGVEAAPYGPVALAASGGDGSYGWEVAAGSLPDGLTLAANGSISGSPTTLGSSDFTVRVVSGDGQSAERALSIGIFDLLEVTTATLPTGVAGTAYGSVALAASGGDGIASWALTAGTLPAGLTLSSGGLLSGTPTAAGTSDFTVEVTSTDGQTADQALSITVYGSLLVTTAELPNAVVSVDYGTFALEAAGGDGDNVWEITSGALPTGLTVSAAGVITGTPSGTGTASFTVRVTSGDGQTDQQALSISVYEALVATTSPLPTGVAGADYGTSAMTATGGDGTYGWALASGSLPAGLTLSAGGDLTGTPDAAGTSNFVVEVTSGDGQTDQQALSVSVYDPLAVTTVSLPTGVQGAAYGSQALAFEGGDGSDTWTLAAGSLPTGINLSSDGVISGTPTVTGTSNFTVQVASGDGQIDQQDLAISVYEPLAVTTASLADATKNEVYGPTSLTASGGDGSNSWTVSVGAMPSGLALSTAGVVSGTPLEFGTVDFTVQVASGDGQTAQQAFSLIIDPPLVLLAAERCSDFPGNPAAAFSDAALEGVVRSALTLGPSDALSCSLVTGLTSLNVIAEGVTSLVGAQNLTGLTSLDLFGNAVDDLTPLADLTALTVLVLTDNPTGDVSALSALTALEELWLGGNGVTDIGPLSGLTALRVLRLEGNGISSISALSALTSLETLSLFTNPIADLSPLTDLILLQTLELQDNLSLSDIGALLANTGLGAGDTVDLRNTGVSCADVALLEAKGVTVVSDCP